MARTVKAHEYEKKRGQILDTAQRLIYTRGYARLTIQDVLDELQISKGASTTTSTRSRACLRPWRCASPTRSRPCAA
jgi:hypothetical protein